MIIYFFIIGLLLGSFLNVCIYRIPRNMSILFPSSHCINCNQSLQRIDLVPVLSWLHHRGKCRYCGCRISGRYAFVEILTGVLCMLAYVTFGWNMELLRALSLLSFLMIIAVIDYDDQLILDKVLILMGSAGIILRLLFTYLYDVGTASFVVDAFMTLNWLDAIFGFLLGGGILYLIAVVSRGAMGGGDIKFAAVLGLWFGWKYILLILFISFLLGGIVSMILLLLKFKNRKAEIPFGPFMAIAAWISYLYGIQIIFDYLFLIV